MILRHLFSPLIVTLIAVAIFLSATGFFVWRWGLNPAMLLPRAPGKTIRVVLGPDGFSPATLTIHKGDTVIFSTTRDKPFWPASDLHPSHTIYPEFDPRKPVAPEKEWRFQFNTAGEWRYHDHLAPLWRGTITVRDRQGTLFSREAPCSDEETGSEKTKCGEDQILATLRKEGIDAAFQMLGDLIARDAVFQENCHGFVHLLGNAAYKKFKANHAQGVAGLSAKTAYCNYGFYHGFMENLIHDQGEDAVHRARDFCDALNKEVTGANSFSSFWSHCLHGIGHGVTDGENPTAYGNVHAMIEPGLALCERIGKDAYEKQLCGSGVFNSLFGALYIDPAYGLNYDAENPHAVCRLQEEPYYRAACYNESVTLLMAIAKNDVREAARFIETMPEKRYQSEAIDELQTYAIRFIVAQNKPYDGIRVCQSLTADLRAPCIAGVGAGFMEWGAPGKEYTQALEVCRSPLLTADEEKTCFARVLWLSSVRYSPEKHAEICESVEKEYQEHCPKASSWQKMRHGDRA